MKRQWMPKILRDRIERQYYAVMNCGMIKDRYKARAYAQMWR